MSFHASQTFTFGEQPSATKWQWVWDNDDALSDGSGIEAGAITASKLDADAVGHGFVEMKRVTLGSPGDTISLTSIPARKFLRLHMMIIPSGAIDTLLRFNNDSGSNYAFAFNVTGPTTMTAGNSVSQTSITMDAAGSAVFEYGVYDIINVATKRKLVMGRNIDDSGNSAAGYPQNLGLFGKWDNSSDSISRIDIINNGAGDMAAGSMVFVEGKD